MPNWWPNGPNGSRCSTSPASRTSGTWSSPSGPASSSPGRKQSPWSSWSSTTSKGDGTPADCGPGHRLRRDRRVHRPRGSRRGSPRRGVQSEFAHAWAAKNLAPLGVNLVRGDLRDALPELNGTFDVVISNPPYIPAEAIPNEPEVALHDPPEALYGGGADGMELPTAAAASAARLLVPGGYFVMEHAEVQAGWIAAMLKRTGVLVRRSPRTWTSTARNVPPAPSLPARTTSDERIGQ